MCEMPFAVDSWVMIDTGCKDRDGNPILIKAQIWDFHNGGSLPSQSEENTRTYIVGVFDGTGKFLFEDRHVDEKAIVGNIYEE